jgi:acetyl/propionyl-CoA carboxylase alpha subunit
MTFKKLLIANRGEIAIRIARAAAGLGIATVAVYPDDDADALHVRQADQAQRLPGHGARAYLDMAAMLDAARLNGCDAVHPGYGFLSENASFASRCLEAGVIFVGPSPQVLRMFGDKGEARALARSLGVALIAGTDCATSMADAQAFMAGLGDGAAVMLKAVSGGGGRGMRAVMHPRDLADAFERCRSEASAAFGDGALYVEQLMPAARHIEVQVLGDGRGGIAHCWERECTLQRRNQKLVEIAPSPTLDKIIADALAMARAVDYAGLGTFEFLVDASGDGGDGDDAKAARYAFIEANPRLQVEHTVTEQVTGIDLVQAQLQIAGGATLADLGLQQQDIPPPRGFAVECRVNLETMAADGSLMPSAGIVSAYEPPSGPGVRVDGCGYAGYAANPGFDSLLAKVIAWAPRYEAALARAAHALSEFRLEGVDSNIDFLQGLLAHPDVIAHRISTAFVERHAAALLSPAVSHRRRHAQHQAVSRATPHAPAGTEPITAPMPGSVLSIDVAVGDRIRAGQQVAVLEAMKMEHLVLAPASGAVRQVNVKPGQLMAGGAPLCHIEPSDETRHEAGPDAEPELDLIRPDLQAAI